MPKPEPNVVPTSEAITIGKISRRTLVELIARGEVTVYRRAGENRNYHSRAEMEEVARRRARPTGRRPVVGLPPREVTRP